MRPIKVGVIGLGVGQEHIEGYRRHPACEVVSLCDSDPGKRRLAQEKYPDIRFASAAGDILSDPGINLVSIATYDDIHAEQVLAAAQNNKHVFVEKPLCLREREAVQIRRAFAQKKHLHLSSNLILRRCPRFLKLREMIKNGDLGEVFSIEGDYHYGRLEKITKGWRGQLPYYSVVHGGAVHMVDLIRWLTEEKIEEVTCCKILNTYSILNHDGVRLEFFIFSENLEKSN